MEEYPALLADLRCRLVFECCSRTERERLGWREANVEQCSDVLEEVLRESGERATALGDLRWNAAAARDCIERMRLQGCDSVDTAHGPIQSYCDGVWTPLLELFSARQK